MPMDYTIQQARAHRTGRRKTRRPVHPFHLHHKPFDITPYFCAPVLPGETMKSAVIQARGYSQPIKNPIVGWWQEYYLFYVPLRSMRPFGDRALVSDIENMLMMSDPPTQVNIEDATTYNNYYHGGSSSGENPIPWLAFGYQRIVDEYFRDEPESGFSPFSAGALAKAAVKGNSWLDSYEKMSNLPQDILDQTPTADIPLGDLDDAYRTWAALTAEKYIEMDFADYLRMNGVTPRAEDDRRPELIYYTSDWQYPTNTINPADVLDAMDEVVVPAGQPSAALSWSHNSAATKNRYFREPGFVIGVTVVRPKMYRKGVVDGAPGTDGQKGQVADYLNSVKDWLPGLLAGDKWSSIANFDAASGPIGIDSTTAFDYMADMRDLFIYGDQLIVRSDGVNAIVDLPTYRLDTTNNNSIKYAADADIDALFVAGEADNTLRQDGVVNFNVLSYEAADAT